MNTTRLLSNARTVMMGLASKLSSNVRLQCLGLGQAWQNAKLAYRQGLASVHIMRWRQWGQLWNQCYVLVQLLCPVAKLDVGFVKENITKHQPWAQSFLPQVACLQVVNDYQNQHTSTSMHINNKFYQVTPKWHKLDNTRSHTFLGHFLPFCILRIKLSVVINAISCPYFDHSRALNVSLKLFTSNNKLDACV